MGFFNADGIPANTRKLPLQKLLPKDFKIGAFHRTSATDSLLQYRIGDDERGKDFYFTGRFEITKDLNTFEIKKIDGTVTGVTFIAFDNRPGKNKQTSWSLNELDGVAVRDFQTRTDGAVTKGLLDGDDTVVGTLFPDRLFGFGGNDVLEGLQLEDVLCGGSGADKLLGGTGRDMASYEDAAKGVTANLGNRKVNKGDAKGDSYSSIEDLRGSQHVDFLTGNGKANRIEGLGKGDELFGLGGHDELRGDGGADDIFGGDGNDLIIGGLGADELTGGKGADKFAYFGSGESTVRREGRDVILDFSQKQKDKIDLSKFVLKVLEIDFVFIKGAAFSGKRGELRAVNLDTETYVYGDVNGDARADFVIELAGGIDLVKGDFIF